MSEPKSTTENSKLWKTLHASNYLFGGSTFLLGSIILFPLLGPYFDDVASVSAWLYTLGSTTFLLADIIEWKHYSTPCCKYVNLSLNFFVSILGSLLYLTGSICIIPKINLIEWGGLQFEIASSFVIISQIWKLYRLLQQKDKTWKQCIQEDESGFYVDLFAGFGGLLYLIGTFLLQESVFDQKLAILSIAFNSFGGLSYFSSALFIQKRYFYQTPNTKQYTATVEGTSVSLQIP